MMLAPHLRQMVKQYATASSGCDPVEIDSRLFDLFISRAFGPLALKLRVPRQEAFDLLTEVLHDAGFRRAASTYSKASTLPGDGLDTSVDNRSCCTTN